MFVYICFLKMSATTERYTYCHTRALHAALPISGALAYCGPLGGPAVEVTLGRGPHGSRLVPAWRSFHGLHEDRAVPPAVLQARRGPREDQPVRRSARRCGPHAD